MTSKKDNTTKNHVFFCKMAIPLKKDISNKKKNTLLAKMGPYDKKNMSLLVFKMIHLSKNWQ